MGAERPEPRKVANTGRDIDSKQFCINVLKALKRTVTSSDTLLQGDDLELIETTCPQVKQTGHETSKRVLAAITAISSRYAVNVSSSDTDSDYSGSDSSLTNRDIVFDYVRETTDEALVQFNSSLDGVRGIKDAQVVQAGAIGPEFRIPGLSATVSKKQGAFVEMEKPQIHFPDYPIDNSDTAFVPPYTGKPHSSTDGAVDHGERSHGMEVDLYLQNLFKTNSKPTAGDGASRKHPYEDEIKAIAAEMSQMIFRKEDTCVYRPLESTPCTLVVTEEDLFNMAERLKQVTEIAVDIENHSVRSFQGFTCLIQISTRREDFIVDALALRGSIHRALAPVFSDESTVKVLHGADKDVQWLERDFGIYVVNMFDTGQAVRLLKYPSAALSYLLARFCEITGTSKKKFQLADWRQRPLPDDMYQYARSDTHYLLYIYDRLRAELAEKELTGKAWQRSAAVSRKRHIKIRYDAGMPRHLCAKYGLGFDPHQIRLLEELYRWRDRRAREEDESLNYVAPLGSLLGIVRARDKARTVEGLREYGFSSRAIPPLIETNAEEVVRLISDSLDAKIDEPFTNAVGNPKLADQGAKTIDLNNERDTDKSHAPVAEPQVTQLTGKPPTKCREKHRRPGTELVQVKASARFKSTLFDEEASDSDNDAASHPAEAESESLVPESQEGRLDLGDPVTREIRKTGLAEVCEMRPIIMAGQEKSVFELSDSDDDNQDDATEGPMKVTSVDDTFRGTEVSLSTRKTPENSDSSVVLPEKVKGPKVSAAKSSVFNLSDDDSCGEKGNEERKEQKATEVVAVLAKVRSSMSDFMPRASAQFRVETDPVATDRVSAKPTAELNSSETKKRNRTEGLEEGEPMSLQERYGLVSKRSKKHKRKKRKTECEGDSNPGSALESFDYDKALREERHKREQSSKETAFDAMQKLRPDWRHKEKSKKRPRKPRKSPGSGVRSMSFKT